MTREDLVKRCRSRLYGRRHEVLPPEETLLAILKMAEDLGKAEAEVARLAPKVADAEKRAAKAEAEADRLETCVRDARWHENNFRHFVEDIASGKYRNQDKRISSIAGQVLLVNPQD